MVAKRWPIGGQMVAQDDPKVVTMLSASKWSPGGNQLIPKWSASGHQFTNWSPIYSKVVNKLSPNDPKLIPNWSQSGQQTVNSKVAWKWFQSQKWSTGGHQRVTKRPTNYSKVVTRWCHINSKVVSMWSPNSDQLISMWLESGHKVVFWQPPSDPKVAPKSKVVKKCLTKGHQTTIL